MINEVIYLGHFGVLKKNLSKFSSLGFIVALKKGVFLLLLKQSSTKSFHITRPLSEILYLVLVSFN